MASDVRDFYITYPNHPKYKKGEIIVDEPLRVIINKIEMVLFTKKGDFIGDVNFGANLEFFLWETNVSISFIQQQIQDQFNTYIPELVDLNYQFNVELFEGELQDILIVNIKVEELEVNAIFRDSI